MSDLRRDRVTGAWVLVSPRRGLRPRDTGPSSPTAVSSQAAASDCPFCPGHEAELPAILSEVPCPEAPGWSVRVVPNKFPAVEAVGEMADVRLEAGTSQSAYGLHEVIIESPQHDADLVTMPASQYEAVITAYALRIRCLLRQPKIETVILFRNRGAKSGASLHHPHAQAVALAVVPPQVQAATDWAARYFEEVGRCPLCHENEIETARGERVIEKTPFHIATVPFAAAHPGEIWIAPLEHQSCFDQGGPSALSDFTALLQRMLQGLDQAYGKPDYNFVIDTAVKHAVDSPSFHWRMRIVPDLVVWGGFELGSGLPINPSSPEKDAALLRSVGR